MKPVLAFLVILTIAFMGCGGNDDEPVVFPAPVPDCLDDFINTFQVATCDAGAYVDEYTFLGNTVYSYWPGDCRSDFSLMVFDTGCELLCVLGGPTNLTECTGVVFADSAKLVTRLWED